MLDLKPMRVLVLLFLAVSGCPGQEAASRVFKSGQVTVTLLEIGPGRLMPVVEVGSDVGAEHAMVTLFYRHRAAIAPGAKAIDLLLSKTSVSPILGPGSAGAGDAVDIAPSEVEFIRVVLMREVGTVDLR